MTRLPIARYIGAVVLLHFFACVHSVDINSADPPDPIRGELHQFEFAESTIFPGTKRDVWVYIPAECDPAVPSCVAAVCDGRAYVQPKQANFAPVVFDDLIASGEMPVTIGVFVNPGIVPAPNAAAQPRFNRSYEYDGLGEDYARFLQDELLPEIERRFDVVLSDDPNDRLVGGASSGGICAFNVAWSRPDWFGRVWCTVGTFVGLRGGDELHTLVRKTESKPLRIFLHDGDQDLNIYAGDWWMANRQMQRALAWRGYEHDFVWDQSKHGRDGEKKFLKRGLRFLWKDYPKQVTTHTEDAAPRRATFLIEGEDWELVSDGHGFN
ncbi:MAG: alpha/beta hydrolase-fold protein [Planctomycetota bacterium]